MSEKFIETSAKKKISHIVRGNFVDMGDKGIERSKKVLMLVKKKQI